MPGALPFLCGGRWGKYGNECFSGSEESFVNLELPSMHTIGTCSPSPKKVCPNMPIMHRCGCYVSDLAVPERFRHLTLHAVVIGVV